jgi:5-(aminomethyl)-3-furanmethanol phosphate kinase
VLTVVKLGGGLVRQQRREEAPGNADRRERDGEAGDHALRALCAGIAEAGARHPLLVVPGGAGFADAVRAHDHRFGLQPRTAHRMAILAMDQFGWALADLIPGALRCLDLGPPRAGGVSVLLPAVLLAERDPLPASWSVTSDSIAAWVAGAAGAERLVLLKPVAGLFRTWPPQGEPIQRLTVDELAALRPAGVDERLPTALRAAGVETWVIDGNEPARLAELLETGSTVGTLVEAERTSTVRTCTDGP